MHLGKKIQEEVHRQGMSVTEFAKRINRTRTVAYDIFKRDSIDTDLLLQIGKVLQVDFFASIKKNYPLPVSQSKLGDVPPHYLKLEKEVHQLRDENRLLKTELQYLKKIIDLLEKGTRKTRKK